MDAFLGRVDHLVYVVPDFELACAEFARNTGVEPVFGGHHLSRGTMNALVKLGETCYLEFLAIDSKNQAVKPPRWMGVDLVDRPMMTRWALASDDLLNDLPTLAAYNPAMGKIDPGQRSTPTGQLLQWSLTPPQATPAVELVPFLIDWSSGNDHPADGLKEGCRIKSLQFFHPQPEEVLPTLEALGVEVAVHQSDTVKIEVELMTPLGLVVL